MLRRYNVFRPIAGVDTMHEFSVHAHVEPDTIDLPKQHQQAQQRFHVATFPDGTTVITLSLFPSRTSRALTVCRLQSLQDSVYV